MFKSFRQQGPELGRFCHHAVVPGQYG